MSKVFGIGLSKTGTSSLCQALRVLDYSVIDFDVGLERTKQFDAATDIPCADAFEALDLRYPGSKFVYTIRNREAWLCSCERHWHVLQVNNTTARLKAKGIDVPDLFLRLYGSVHFDAELFDRAYDRHDRRVADYFSDRREHLLVMDICAGEDWTQLCPFLGRPVPGGPFPHENRAKSRSHFYAKQVLRFSGLAFRPRKLWRELAGRF